MSGAPDGWVELTSRGGAYRSLDIGGGYPLRVLTTAEPKGAPRGAVVLIHGMEEPWEVWESLVEPLSAEGRVYMLDLPWSGRQGYDWALDRVTCAEWLKRGLDAVPEPIVGLVAHSFGAMTALDYLDVAGTGDLRGVVLISPLHLPRGRPFDWALIDRYSDRFVPFLEAALQARSWPRRMDAEIAAAAASIVREKIGPAGCLEFLYLFAKSPRLRLERMRIPFLVLAGETDFFSTPDVCRALAGDLPRAELRVLPECGHFCMLEQAEQTAALLRDFMRHSLGHRNMAGQKAAGAS